MGIPALEDGLFANLMIVYYSYYTFCLGKEKGREKRREEGKGKGKGKGKGREKGKEITKIARVPSCEVGSTVIRDYTVYQMVSLKYNKDGFRFALRTCYDVIIP